MVHKDARVAARSHADRPDGAPESRAAQAQKDVLAGRIREVSHSLMAACKRTVMAHPCVVVDRSREAAATAHGRTAAARSQAVADHKWETGDSRVAARKRTVRAHNWEVADRIVEEGHK